MKKNKLAISLFVVYLVIIVWILLFKMTSSWQDLQYSLTHPVHSLNLLPFGDSVIVNGKIYLMEIVYNLIIFIPFGGLLGIVDKKHSFWQKLLLIVSFSLIIETLQFIFGIGASDITDLILNTSGGFIGLIIYSLLKKFFPEKKLDKILLTLGTIIFSLCLGFIFFMLLIN